MWHRINVGEGATISSSEKKSRSSQQNIGNFLYCVNKLPNSCRRLPYRQDEKKLFFSRMEEGKGARGLGKGCDFHLQRPESDLWCRSGITPLKSELWINRQLHLSPQSCHSQGCKAGAEGRELCQFYKEQAGGDPGSEPAFQSMPLPLWLSSSVISTRFSGSCWLLPHSQNSAGWFLQRLRLSARTCLNFLHVK